MKIPMVNISTGEIQQITNFFNKVVYKYEKYNNNITKTISLLLDNIQKLMGTDIMINNQSYNLFWNIYIIDHDYNGNKLEQPILIYEKDNKFRIIESHNHFKRNVIVYTMQKNTKYELFYDLEEKIFLGYREINKEYIDYKKKNIKLKVNYSFKNIFTLFGFTREQINIRDFYPEIYGYSQENFQDKFKNFNMELFINKIANRRFCLIKKLGIELKKYINRFKNNYKINVITIEATFSNNLNQQVTNTYISDSANNPLDLIYNKFQKKLDQHIVTEIPNNKKNIGTAKNKINNKTTESINENDLDIKHTFLKYINLINTYLPFDNLKISKNDIPTFSEFVNYNIIFKNDYMSNVILNYILDEIIRLLDYNSNKNIKTNIIHFMLEIICTLFNQTFSEISNFNQELNYFHQILYTSEFYLETQTSEYMMDAIDYYSNQEEIKNIDILDDEQREHLENEIENDNEEFEGMDMADEVPDAEGMFDLYTIYNNDALQKATILV